MRLPFYVMAIAGEEEDGVELAEVSLVSKAGLHRTFNRVSSATHRLVNLVDIVGLGGRGTKD